MKHPLCVDMDGTLIATDLFWESLVTLLKRNPLYMFRIFFWGLRGRLFLKHQISNHVDLDVSSLPYRSDVLSLIESYRQKGHQVWLVSANTSKYVQSVARFVGLFDQVLSSTETQNLKGRTKAKRLVEELGEKQFDYIGDDWVDHKVFAHAQLNYLVTSQGSLERKMAQKGLVFEDVLFEKKITLSLHRTFAHAPLGQKLFDLFATFVER